MEERKAGGVRVRRAGEKEKRKVEGIEGGSRVLRRAGVEGGHMKSTELQYEVKACFHCTRIESDTQGSRFTSPASENGGRKAGLPGFSFHYLAASVASMEKKQKNAA